MRSMKYCVSSTELISLSRIHSCQLKCRVERQRICRSRLLGACENRCETGTGGNLVGGRRATDESHLGDEAAA